MPPSINDNLTWVKSIKQWRKRCRGKTYYLGTGNGKSDRAAHRRALAKWRVIKQEIDDGDRRALAEERRLAAQALSQRLHQLPWRVRQRFRVVNRQRPHSPLLDAVKSGRPAGHQCRTVNELLDLFIKEQEQRYERGQAFPNAPRKERLSASRLIAIKSHIKSLRTCLAHKDKRMARYYVDGTMLDCPRLDTAIDELESYYGLTFSKQSG